MRKVKLNKYQELEKIQEILINKIKFKKKFLKIKLRLQIAGYHLQILTASI